MAFASLRFLGLGLGVAAAIVACGSSNKTNFANNPTTSSAGAGGGTSGGGCTVAGQKCPVLCDATLGCVNCLQNTDCGKSAPVCVAGQCVQCGSDADCPVAAPSCYPNDHTCKKACTGNQDCGGNTPICDATSHACVGCSSAADCKPGAPICSPTSQKCVQCAANKDCGAAAPVCDVANGQCVQCLVDSQCASGQACIDQQCQTNPNMMCGVAGQIVCGGKCISPATDAHHCGSCNNDCGTGTCVSGQCMSNCAPNTIACGGKCLAVADLAVDPNNCGGCNKGCNDGQYCTNSMCECRPGLAFAKGECRDLNTDPNACGQSLIQCKGNLNKCQNGTCVPDCINAQDCNGHCVNTDTDPLHCGDCGTHCNADQVCVNGSCRKYTPAVGCQSCPCDACNQANCCGYPKQPSYPICLEGGCPG